MRLAWLGGVAFVMACQPSRDAAVSPAAWRHAPVVCPESTSWNGEVCVWRYVMTEVRCPQSSEWDGERCVAKHIACPEGASWDGERCVATREPLAEDRQGATPAAAEEAPLNERSPVPTTTVDAFEYR